MYVEGNSGFLELETITLSSSRRMLSWGYWMGERRTIHALRELEKSPIDVVKLFNENYGGPRMDKIADYTTANFRDNKPKSVWVVDTWRALKKISCLRLPRCVM